MANGESSSPPPDDFNISEADYYGRTSDKALAAKSLSRANRRFFGDDSTAATQDKFYSTLCGFIIAQLRKEA